MDGENQTDTTKVAYTPPPESNPQKIHKPMSLFKRIFVIVVGTVCLFGIWSTLFPDKPANTRSNSTTSTLPNTTPTIAIYWKMYTNKIYNYSVEYPDNLKLSEDSPVSILFSDPKKAVTPGDFPPLYISIITSANIPDSPHVYNFMPGALISSFSAMKDGETELTQTGTYSAYWMYKKLATIPIAGTKGVVIQNNKVWGGGDTLRDRRILFSRNGATYIIGGYFQTQQELDALFHFVTSFKFL